MEQPITREEQYLAAIAGGSNPVPDTPITRTEQYLAAILEGGSGADLSVIAPEYSAESTYAEGDLCTYDGKLYKANQDIDTAEEWDETHWTETDIATELADVADPEAIAEAVGDWLGDHVDPETGYVIDDTFTVENAAPDSKKTGEELNSLKSALSGIETATATDVNKALSPKTVTNGKVTEWQYKNIGGGAGVADVKINGTSVVDGNGDANIPLAGTSSLGVARVSGTYGTQMTGTNSMYLGVIPATDNEIKSGTASYKIINPGKTDITAFYGMAKAAGDSTQKDSANAVGIYTEAAKSAIQTMLSAPETVSGTTPTIAAKAGVQYICGEVSTIDFTPSASGVCDVVFTSGSTPAVLTIPNTVKFPSWFDPDNLDANTTYEINILNGTLGAVMAWA